MDIEEAAILLRMVERIFAVGAGGIAIYFGYRLFALLPVTQQDSTGQLSLPGVKVVLARVSPGLLFAALGVSIVLFTLHSKIQVPLPRQTDSGTATKALETEASARGNGASGFVGMVPTTEGNESHSSPSPSGGEDVRALIADLNCLIQVSRFPSAPYPQGADSLELAVVQLLLSKWRREWGDPQALYAWHRSGDSPLPAAVKDVLLAMPKDCPEAAPQ